MERQTPYDIVFREGEIDFDARFEDVRAEAGTRGMDVDDPERLVDLVGEIGRLGGDLQVLTWANQRVGDGDRTISCIPQRLGGLCAISAWSDDRDDHEYSREGNRDEPDNRDPPWCASWGGKFYRVDEAWEEH